MNTEVWPQVPRPGPPCGELPAHNGALSTEPHDLEHLIPTFLSGSKLSGLLWGPVGIRWDSGQEKCLVNYKMQSWGKHKNSKEKQICLLAGLGEAALDTALR